MSNFYSRQRRIPIAAVVTLLRNTDEKTAQPMEKLYSLCTGPIVLATMRKIEKTEDALSIRDRILDGTFIKETVFI